MYPRQRNNGMGNGYRSNPMGMNASRISPEGSMRGHRMYNNNNSNSNEYRNYNRGGYGQPKQFHHPPPLPPQRETDIFVEAGKLAAQYLVSKGVIPPNALSGKWQNEGVKNMISELRATRQREVESAMMYTSGRVSAPEVETGKRKLGEEAELIGGTRSFVRGVVRSESLKFYGSERQKELGKSGSWAGRSRDDMNASPEIVSKDCTRGDQMSPPVEMTQDSGRSANVETEMEKSNLLEDVSAKESSFRNEVSDVVQEQVKVSDDANMSDAVSKAGEVDNNKDMETENKEDGEEGSLVSEDDADLVKHRKYEDDDQTLSSLTNKGSISDNKDEGDFVEKVSEVHALEVDLVNSTGTASSEKTQELNIITPDSTITAPVENEPDVTMTKHRLDDDRMSGFGNISSIFMEKGVKRAIDDDNDGREDMKKLREWVPPTNAQFDDFQKQEPVNSKTAYITLSDDQSVSQFPRDFNDSCEFMKERQLFPSSFKTCDLNLVGMSLGVNANRGVAKPAHPLPSVAETGKQGAAIDVDLSMNNNSCNTNSKNGRSMVNNNHIEIIDLEDESAQEDNNGSLRRGDMTFTELDGFHNNVNNGNEMTEQDGYGLMISELLGNESPNSSPVAPGLNPMHNHMDLPNGEGMLGDDDSIYMSLGEIPISLLGGAWEQPTQDYGKPF